MDDQARKMFVSDVPKEALLQENNQVVLSPTASQIRYILASDQYPLGLRHSRLTFKKCDVVSLVDRQSGAKRRMRKTFKRIDVDSWTDDEIREFWKKKDAKFFTKTDDELALLLRKYRAKVHPKKSKLKDVKSGQDVLSSPSAPSSPIISAPSVSVKASDLLIDDDEKKTKQKRKGKGRGDRKKKKGSDDTEKFIAPVIHGKFGSSRRKAVTVIPPIAQSSSGNLITTSKTVLIEQKSSAHREDWETMLTMTHSISRSEIFCPVQSGYRSNWTYVGAMALSKVQHTFNVTDKNKPKVPSALQMRWQVVTTSAARRDACVSERVVKKLESIVAKTTAARDTALMASMQTKTWLNARWDDQEIVPEHVTIDDLLRKHAPRKPGGALKQVERTLQQSVDVSPMLYRHGSLHRTSGGRRQSTEKQQRQERPGEAERPKRKKAASKKKGSFEDAKVVPRSSGERGSKEDKRSKAPVSEKELEKEISRRGAVHKIDPIQKFLPKRKTADFLPQTRVDTGSWNLQIPQDDTISTASELEDWLKLQTHDTTEGPDIDRRNVSKPNILSELYDKPHLLKYSLSRREVIRDPDSMENLDDSLLERVLDLPQAEFHSALRAMMAPTSVNKIDLTPKLQLKTSARKGSASKLTDSGATKKTEQYSSEASSRKPSARDRYDPLQERGSREKSLPGLQIRAEESSQGKTIAKIVQERGSREKSLPGLQIRAEESSQGKTIAKIVQERGSREKSLPGLQIRAEESSQGKTIAKIVQERGSREKSLPGLQIRAEESSQGKTIGQMLLSPTLDPQTLQERMTLIEQDKGFTEGKQTFGSGKHKKGLQVKESKFKEGRQLTRSRENDQIAMQKLVSPFTQGMDVSDIQRVDDLATLQKSGSPLQGLDPSVTLQRVELSSQIRDPALTQYRGESSPQKSDSSVAQQRDVTTSQISDPLLPQYRAESSPQKSDSSVAQQRDVTTSQIRDPLLKQYRGTPSPQRPDSSVTLKSGVSSREKVDSSYKSKSGVLIRRSKHALGSPKLNMTRKQRRDIKQRQRKDLKPHKGVHEEDVSPSQGVYDSLSQRQRDVSLLAQKAASLQQVRGGKPSQRLDSALAELRDLPVSTFTDLSDFEAEESSSSQDSDVSDMEHRETADVRKKRKDAKAIQRKEAKLKRHKEGRMQHKKHLSQLDPEDPYFTQQDGYAFSQDIDSFKPKRDMNFPLAKPSASTDEEDALQVYESMDSSSRPQHDDRILTRRGSPPKSVRKRSRSFSAAAAKRDSAEHMKEKALHLKPPIERKYMPGENLAERFAHDPRVRRARREQELLLQREAEAAKFKFEGWDDEGKEGTYTLSKPSTVIQNAQELLKMMDKDNEHDMLMRETCGQEKPSRPTQQLEGLAYLSTFGLEELFEYMLCNLVHYRPESPLDYLINMTRYIILQMKIRFETGAVLRQQSVHTVTEVDSVNSLNTTTSFTSGTETPGSIIFNATQDQDSSQPQSRSSIDS